MTIIRINDICVREIEFRNVLSLCVLPVPEQKQSIINDGRRVLANKPLRVACS